ncbi:hypothetical protein FACS1894190_08000 [Spirochaetia bacterium]|nr:hypothetical protein FACS1894190_08000 [Spirochaetia bacterium]
MIYRNINGYKRNILRVFFFVFAATSIVTAQDASDVSSKEQTRYNNREHGIILKMITRVLDQDKTVTWNSDSQKTTIPGRPVGLKIAGDNVAVSIQFTPYPRRNGNGVLVAQSQIWVEIPGEGIQYRTTMQTIPLKFGEQVFFFPLGNGAESAHIEIQIEMSRFESASVKDSSDTVEFR